MAWVFGGKKFGQYTYEHWFDDEEYEELKPKNAAQKEVDCINTEKSNQKFAEDINFENTDTHKP